MDQSFTFIGVNVTSDFHKIGRDFSLTPKTTQQIKTGVINLGKFACVRDVVESGSVGLAKLCEIVLKISIEKGSGVRFSDWSTKTVKYAQIKYAALDAIASHMIYIKLEKMPDLTSRLTKDEIELGMKVDIVSKNGSVACMATRNGTATVVVDEVCTSPHGISPRTVTRGNGFVTVKINTVYSNALYLPKYKVESTGKKATLQYFQNSNVVIPLTMVKQHVASNMSGQLFLCLVPKV